MDPQCKGEIQDVLYFNLCGTQVKLFYISLGFLPTNSVFLFLYFHLKQSEGGNWDEVIEDRSEIQTKQDKVLMFWGSTDKVLILWGNTEKRKRKKTEC